jgi:hypothetical protein
MRRLLRAIPWASALVLSLALAREARAADAPASDAWLTRRPETRTGIQLGLTLGGGVAGSSGYPNNATKIGDPDYYSASGIMGGSTFSLLIMGALSDYLNFGFWFGSASFQNHDWRSTGGGGGFRLEVFPLYAWVPKLKNLGVAGQFGIGTTTLDAKFKANVSSDGTESFLGAGVFYEAPVARFLGGHAALGPSLEYDVIQARSIERNGMTLSLRAVFYGGP